jgi:hypothetical protein
MRKLVTAALGLLGLGASAPATDAQVTSIDPRKVLFSMSTIAGGEVPYDQGTLKIEPSDFVMHEDEWRQIEFFPKSRLNEIKGKLAELAGFEKVHRVADGYRQIYQRDLPMAAVIPGPDALGSLQSYIGKAPGPGAILF